MGSSIAALLVATATAAEVDGDVTIGVRAAGESVQDPWLAAAYGAQGLGGELTASVPLPKGLRLRFAVGYHRRGGNLLAEDKSAESGASWLMYAPLSAPVFADLDVGSVKLGAGVGPTYLIYSEPPSPDGVSGGKFGLDFELEARVATGMVQRSLHAPDEGPERLDVVLSAGYRWAFKYLTSPLSDTGLDFSAVRLGVGAELVY